MLSAIPNTRDLVSQRVESTPTGQVYPITDYPAERHVAIFEYPDCTRTYDGERWTVTARS